MNSYFSPKAWMGLVLLSLCLVVFSACNKENLEDFSSTTPPADTRINAEEENADQFNIVELFGEEDELQSREYYEIKQGCKLTFSSQQDYTCCGDNTCSCSIITISGLVASSRTDCCNGIVSIWFSSPYLCTQETWNGSNTVTINLNSAQACIDLDDGSCQYIDVPVTMNYIYYCNDKAYRGTYNSSVTMLLC